MIPVSSWGRLKKAPHHLRPIHYPEQLEQSLKHCAMPGLPYGMGRSYGDVCLNTNGALWAMSGLDHLVDFDKTTGRILCEAGTLLRDIQRAALPYGWMLPVTPGTQLVTVGGAIANDVHGKNHHLFGTFGNHIKRLSLMRTDGEVIHCGPCEHSQWFAATVGGLGLTGIIVQAEIQLRRVHGPWLETETVPYHNLSEFFSYNDASEDDWEHTVSWVDCLSGGNARGVFMRANPSMCTNTYVQKTPKSLMPFVPPISLVNRISLRAFNSAYFYLKKYKSGRSLMHYEPFFYPLDNINAWNRMYGPKGFYQYQCVVPFSAGEASIQDMLKTITTFGCGSFLSVLKTFGKQAPVGMLSFPQPGITLALDFPNQGSHTLRLFERLDAIVQAAKGRLYPAKDARMSSAMFRAGYPRLSEFMAFRDLGISSDLSRRLMGV